MPLFPGRVKRLGDLGSTERVPPRFEALVDAMEAGIDPSGVLDEIGYRAGRDGVALPDLLAELAATYCAVTPGGREPQFLVVQALCTAWADTSLRYLHDVSCEDPLTGLTSLAHVRTRIVELYREAGRSGSTGPLPYALLVVDLEWRRPTRSRFDQVLRMVDVSELMHTVYSGEETIGQLTPSRAVALVRRDERLGRSVGTLRSLLLGWQTESGASTRLWVEGLPAYEAAASALLDELAR